MIVAQRLLSNWSKSKKILKNLRFGSSVSPPIQNFDDFTVFRVDGTIHDQIYLLLQLQLLALNGNLLSTELETTFSLPELLRRNRTPPLSKIESFGLRGVSFPRF